MRAQRLIVQEATQSLEALLRSQETLRGMAAAARACQKDCVPSQAPALMSRRLSRSFDVSWAGCFGSFKSGQESGLLFLFKSGSHIPDLGFKIGVPLGGGVWDWEAPGSGARPSSFQSNQSGECYLATSGVNFG